MEVCELAEGEEGFDEVSEVHRGGGTQSAALQMEGLEDIAADGGSECGHARDAVRLGDGTAVGRVDECVVQLWCVDRREELCETRAVACNFQHF